MEPAGDTLTPASPGAGIVEVSMQIDDMISCDPQESFEFSGGEITGNIYEKLIIPDTEDPTKIRAQLAERRARTRSPTQAPLRRSASCSVSCPRHACADTTPGVSALMSKAGVAKIAKAAG